MQTVVITGGTSGIGLATADIFLKNGWNAVLIGRDAEKGMQVERQLGERILRHKLLLFKPILVNQVRLNTLSK